MIALSSATAAMIGQNFGAGRPRRIRATLRLAASMAAAYMAACTILLWLLPAELTGLFTRDRLVIDYGQGFLSIYSLSNFFVGMIMVVGATFQGLGKTYPTLIGATVDNAVYAALVFSLPALFGWGILSIWWIKTATTVLEALIVAFWLRTEIRWMKKPPTAQGEC